jgi:phosphinothricin acetyltransferase
VRQDQRGQGVGRVLLADLLERATAHGFHAVFARIVGGHAASIALHVNLGFEEAGIEREVGRKFGRWLDVVVLEKLL